MSEPSIAALIRGWVDLYTRGLSTEVRSARRDEIADDLWCHREEALAIGRSMQSLDRELLARLVFGIPADVAWRMAPRRGGSADRSPGIPTRARTLGALALVSGLTWGSVLALAVPYGADLWVKFGYYTGTALLVGAIAIVVTALGLAMLHLDRIRARGAVGAALVAIGALAVIGGSAGSESLLSALPIGSALLLWELADLDVSPRWIPLAEASAAVATVLILLIADTYLVVVPFAVFLVGWVALGVSLLRNVPMGRTAAN